MALFRKKNNVFIKNFIKPRSIENPRYSDTWQKSWFTSLLHHTTVKPNGLGPYSPAQYPEPIPSQGPQAPTKWLGPISILPVSTLGFFSLFHEGNKVTHGLLHDPSWLITWVIQSQASLPKHLDDTHGCLWNFSTNYACFDLRVSHPWVHFWQWWVRNEFTMRKINQSGA